MFILGKVLCSYIQGMPHLQNLLAICFPKKHSDLQLCSYRKTFQTTDQMQLKINDGLCKFFNMKTYLTIFTAQKFSDLPYTLTVNVGSFPRCLLR